MSTRDSERLNSYLATAAGISRRQADAAIAAGRVRVNNQTAVLGARMADDAVVTLDGCSLAAPPSLTILLNKPVGYVCSRRGQGAPTIYNLLPKPYQRLQVAGRLDKDSSGLIILTNDGHLAQKLTHPRYRKEKVYLVSINKCLSHADLATLNKGVLLSDGISSMRVERLVNDPFAEAMAPLKPYPSIGQYKSSRTAAGFYRVSMREGRNRQIRRSFEALGYRVRQLRRLSIDSYHLSNLPSGHFRPLSGDPKTESQSI